MGKQGRRTHAGVLALRRGLLTLSVLLLAVATALQGQTVSAVPSLDAKQLQGAWYEIARLPGKQEKKCIGDAIELVAQGEKANQLLLVDSCKTKNGYADVRNYTANPQDKRGDGEYKITTLWPFSRKYWVMAAAPDFSWTLIGSPNRKDLWVFSKQPTLSPEILTAIEAKAAAEGFATAKLISGPQSRPGS